MFSQPDVVFSDGDEKIASAIEELRKSSGTTHLLCTWHLFKNVDKRLRCLINMKNDIWKKMSNYWWRICKETDERSKVTFDCDWNNFAEFVKNNTKENIDKETVSETKQL